MTLAQRLLLAISVLTIATTVTLAYGVRTAWRTAEEARFHDQFAGAVGRLDRELDEELATLPAVLGPLCDHNPVLDGALIDLRSGQLDPGRRLALGLRVPELMKALGLDELVLVAATGEVLGAGHDSGLTGSRNPKLWAEVAGAGRAARVRTTPAPPAIEAQCVRAIAGAALGLRGARRLETVLRRAGASQGVTLSLGAPEDTADVWVEEAKLRELAGISVVATRSKLPLREALRGLDREVALLGGATLGLAILVAFVVSRGLARPIVSLSEQARRVVDGEPVPVKGGGGRELSELARSFNQAIHDLAALRKRLAATERIAARREIARRVAHEIKNPLAPIRAAVETLRRLRGRADPAFDEYFDEATRTVLDEVQRITAIVQEFTEFARLPPPNPAPLDLEHVTRDVVTLHSASGVPIELRASPIPAVTANRDQIVQVLTNLLQNAMDAVSTVSAGRIVVEIRKEDGGHVALVVRDNGPGLAAEMRARLFEPYATTKERGTGLGLAIVERIVVEHGGDIGYRDAAGGGAEFTVVLPVRGPTLLPEPPSGLDSEGRVAVREARTRGRGAGV